VLPPVQVSATSHAPAEARQTKPDGCRASTGHAVLEPVQVSAASHRADGGTTDGAPDGARASADTCCRAAAAQRRHTHRPRDDRPRCSSHLPDRPPAPVHVSATSHPRPSQRARWCSGRSRRGTECAGAGAQFSPTSQTPPAGPRHTTVFAEGVLRITLRWIPSHISQPRRRRPRRSGT
jgi:hypothetical protein